ncbi:MAG: glycosyltransferase family 4 protein [Coriobacteriia bacterium]|nr:glycosyltransferase family 4 protein [Coriobacteriia bacterium]
MRVLYIHQFFATRESELGLIRSYEFSRRMLAAGHEVTMVTSSSRLAEDFSRRLFNRGEIDGIDVRAIRVRYSNYMGYARRMWSFALFTVGATWIALTAPRPDVVFATSTPLTVGIPGWIASALRGVPFVFEVRDLWPEAAIQMGAIKRGSVLARFAGWLERFLYRRATAVIALSPGMAEGVMAHGIDEERVHTIPNSCDLDLFSPGPKDAEIAEQFDIAGRFVVAYAGAIGPSNGLEDIVPQAARLLAERGREDITFLIAGDGKSLPRMRELKEEWALGNMILAGSMPKHDIPRLLRTADVLMTLFADVPILAVNSPNKFFDGIATGKPMLVNSPGWTRDLVQENDIGVYVPPTDANALADAVERLAADPEAVERMGRNARSLAEREFDRNDLAARLIGVLEEAVRARMRR